ncbi:MAG: sulfurtransferase-like selenium metabolism protein YedF [Lachnospiraceae bacterium]|nr:sulfurtransferase-like selenium metabolism protein YedF [Lachnospiraceae bacterium]
MGTKTVDARGLACPLPVVNAKQAADGMTDGGMLTVLVDNEIAVQNLTKFAAARNYETASEKKGEKEFEVRMKVTAAGAGAAAEKADGDEEITCAPDSVKRGIVAVLSSNKMGSGDEKLGKNLMKAFIFALSKQDVLPETILCYNSGAFLTNEGSESLEDLKNMEAEGVKILTCGTCMDFYGIKETLAVGGVTNMYDIVEIQEKAGKILRP